MKSNVIYYPYMQMPKDEWFSQVALYWDKLYTMTTSYHSSSWKFPNSYEEKLVKSKLIEPIDIKEHLGDRDKLEKILDYVDSPDYPIPHDKNKWEASEKMFHQKMEYDPEVLRELKGRGLITNRAINGWYEVESFTAKLYMAYLAEAIGADRDINANSITDRHSYLEYSVKTNKSEEAPENSIQISNIVLKNILPSPARCVDPELIAQFKKNNQEELKNFREYLQNEIRKIASQKPIDQKESIEQLIKDEQSNMKGLEDKMRANGWRNIIRSNWSTFIASLTSSIILAPATGGLSLIPTLIGYEIWGINENIKKKKMGKKLMEDKHFYLVSAKKEFKSP